MKNLKNFLKINDSKILKVRNIGYIFCLILGLLSAFAFSFYYITDYLYEFKFGFVLLRLSIFYFCGFCGFSCFWKNFKS